ncbi:MAG: YncE family protein [Vicinamibacterales bacterium]
MRFTFSCAVMFTAAAIVHAQGTPSIGQTVKVGSGLYEIAASPSTGTVYVAGAGGRGAEAAKPAVFALNGRTLAIEKQFDVSATPAYGLGFNDKTQTLYTTNTRNASVSAIDVKSGSIKEIKTPADPQAHLREVAVDEVNNVIYMSSYGNDGKIWVVDGKTNTVSKVIEHTGNGTAGLAVDPAGKRLFVTNMNAHEVAVIDTTSYEIKAKYPAGAERPSNLAYDAKSKRLFVANQAGNVTVLDPEAGGKVLGTIPTGAGTLDVELNPVTGFVYTANRAAGTVSVINPTTFAVVATLPTGTANTIAVDTKSGLVYVTNKMRPQPRGGRQGGDGRQGAGAPPSAPAAPPAPVEDQNGDSVTLIRH